MYVYIELETQDIYFDEKLGTVPILELEHKKLLNSFKHPKDIIAKNEDGTFYVVHYKPTQEEIELEKQQQAQESLDNILEWFSENDWKANKIALKEWDENDPRALEYLQQRKEKREQHADLCSFLGINNDR